MNLKKSVSYIFFFSLIFIFCKSNFLFSMDNNRVVYREESRDRRTDRAVARFKEKRYLRGTRFFVKSEHEEARNFYVFLKDSHNKYAEDNGAVENNMKKKHDSINEEIRTLNDKLKDLSGKGSGVQEKIDHYMESLERFKKEDALLKKFMENLPSKSAESVENVKRVLEEAESDVEALKSEYEKLNVELSGYRGDIIFRGIAGDKNWEMVEDLRVGNDIWEGFKNGVMLRGSVSVGKAIGTSVDGYVAKIFDGTLGKIEELLGAIYRWIFHSSCKPFKVEEIGHWKKLVGSDLREIEFMIKNVEKLDSRGRTEILREYESEEVEQNMVNLWRDFVEDLALTYQELAEEIKLRKGYYEEKYNGFGVGNCADRLISKLLKTKEWFLGVKSLKELANIPEAKSIIPAMKKSFDNYFDNLADQIRPLSDKKSSVNLTGSTSNRDRWSSSSNSYDSSSIGVDYPKMMY